GTCPDLRDLHDRGTKGTPTLPYPARRLTHLTAARSPAPAQAATSPRGPTRRGIDHLGRRHHAGAVGRSAAVDLRVSGAEPDLRRGERDEEPVGIGVLLVRIPRRAAVDDEAHALGVVGDADLVQRAVGVGP